MPFQLPWLLVNDLTIEGTIKDVISFALPKQAWNFFLIKVFLFCTIYRVYFLNKAMEYAKNPLYGLNRSGEYLSLCILCNFTFM